MIDPIGAYMRVADSVISYIETAFGTRFPSLEAEREPPAPGPGALSQEPWIEPLPGYQSSGKTVDSSQPTTFPGFPRVCRATSSELAACGLVGDFPLHRHQVEMLTTALGGQRLRRHCRNWLWQDRIVPASALRLPGARIPQLGTASPRHHHHQTTGGASDEWRDHCDPLVGPPATLEEIPEGPAAGARPAPGGCAGTGRLPDERARRRPAEPPAPCPRLAAGTGLAGREPRRATASTSGGTTG